jgi:hypothetical protein
MALQSLGAITLAQIQAEFGGANDISISEYQGLVPGLPVAGQQFSFSDFYGKSAWLNTAYTSSYTTSWRRDYTRKWQYRVTHYKETLKDGDPGATTKYYSWLWTEEETHEDTSRTTSVPVGRDTYYGI